MTRHFTPFLRWLCVFFFSLISSLSAQYLEKVIPVPYRLEDNGATVEPGVLFCSPNGSKLYCIGDWGWTIVIDCATNRIIKELPTEIGSENAFYWQRNNKLYVVTDTYYNFVTAVIDLFLDSIVAFVPALARGVFNDSENCYLANIKVPDHTLPDQQIVDGFEKYFYGLAVLDGTTNQIRSIFGATRPIRDMVWNSCNNRYCLFSAHPTQYPSPCIMTVFDARTNQVIDSVVIGETEGAVVKATYVPQHNKIFLALSDALLVIDGETNQTIKRFSGIRLFGDYPCFFYNPLVNKLYTFAIKVPQNETTFTLVIDCNSDSIIKWISVSPPGLFCEPVFNPRLNWLYFEFEGDNRIGVLDCNADTLLRNSISISGYLPDLCCNATRNRLYASVNNKNLILVFDAENLEILDTIVTGLYCNCDVGGVIFNHKVNKIYARNYFSGDTTRLSILSVIDGATGRKIKHIWTGAVHSYGDRAMCLHPEGEKLYLTNSGSNTLTVIDCNSDSIVKTVYLPESPEYVALNTEDHKLYCTHGYTPLLSIIDYEQDTLLTTVSIPQSNYAFWVVWHPAVNKVYIEDREKLIVVYGPTNQVLTTIPRNVHSFSYETPGVCNTTNAKLYFLVDGIPEGAFYSVDAIADTILTEIRQLRSAIGITWHQRTNKVYFHALPWPNPPQPQPPKFWIINCPNDSLIKTIQPIDLSWDATAQTTPPISHPHLNRVYFLFKHKGLVILDCALDSIVKYLPFFPSEEWAEYGMSLDTGENRIYVITPSSHIYVFKDEIVGIQSGSADRLGLQVTVSPNPFRNYVEIRYHLPHPTKAEIKIFSADGRLVRLLNQADKQAGNHTFFWDGTDESRNRLPPGAYFIYLQANHLHLTRKILLTQ